MQIVISRFRLHKTDWKIVVWHILDRSWKGRLSVLFQYFLRSPLRIILYCSFFLLFVFSTVGKRLPVFIFIPCSHSVHVFLCLLFFHVCLVGGFIPNVLRTKNYIRYILLLISMKKLSLHLYFHEFWKKIWCSTL